MSEPETHSATPRGPEQDRTLRSPHRPAPQPEPTAAQSGAPARPVPDAATVKDTRAPQAASAAAHDSAIIGQTFGRYRVVRELGRGGMGVVYEAHESQLNRVVALKILGHGPSITTEDRERFTREARLCARLAHPNIVPVHDVGEAHGTPFFAMSLVKGGSLADWMHSRPIEIREAVTAIREVARAVGHAHAEGVIHRDLKPSNVLCDRPDGADPAAAGVPRLLVTDFGLGKSLNGPAAEALTATGAVLGTPAYMSPEQAGARSAEVAAWSDVYSLGAMLYELLTGRPPFTGDSPWEVCAKVLRDEPTSPRVLNPRLSRDLETVIAKAMDKNPRRRYATARDLAEDLDRFLAGEAITARATTLQERVSRWVRRDPRAATLLGVALLAPFAVATTLFLSAQAQATRHDDASQPYWRGVRALAEGEPIATAGASFTAALAIESDHVEALLERADLELEWGNFATALTHIDEACAAAPHNALPPLMRGLTLLELGRVAQARETWSDALDGPRDGPSRWWMHALHGWLADPEIRPPQPGFRWPATTATAQAVARRPDGSTWRKLRDSATWQELDVVLRLRPAVAPLLLVIDALTRDGDLDAARDLLLRARNLGAARPGVLAWTARLGRAEDAQERGEALRSAIAQADRAELRLLAAEAARAAGDALTATKQEQAAADLANASAHSPAPAIAAYWSAWLAVARQAGGDAAGARAALQAGGWLDAPDGLWPTALAR